MTDMPKEIWVIAGADDPSLEFTAMRDKEYETAIKYTLAEPASAGDGNVLEIINRLENATRYMSNIHPSCFDTLRALAQTPTATDAEAQKALDDLGGIIFSDGAGAVCSWVNKYQHTIRAALSRMAPQWQDISTAPRDNSVILACVPKFKSVMVGTMYEFPLEGFKISGWQFTSNGRAYVATHWMPLPAPPADREG